MNICFVMSEGNQDKEQAFLDYASAAGMYGLKGHRSVGGFRASCYNALPTASVEALIKCMQNFEEEKL